MLLKDRLEASSQALFGCALSDCDAQKLYRLLFSLCQEMSLTRPAPAGEKKLYYFSAEFLMGRLLTSSLIALGLYDEARALLSGIRMKKRSDLPQIDSRGNYLLRPTLAGGVVGFGLLAHAPRLRAAVAMATAAKILTNFMMMVSPSFLSRLQGAH